MSHGECDKSDQELRQDTCPHGVPFRYPETCDECADAEDEDSKP